MALFFVFERGMKEREGERSGKKWEGKNGFLYKDLSRLNINGCCIFLKKLLLGQVELSNDFFINKLLHNAYHRDMLGRIFLDMFLILLTLTHYQYKNLLIN